MSDADLKPTDPRLYTTSTPEELASQDIGLSNNADGQPAATVPYAPGTEGDMSGNDDRMHGARLRALIDSMDGSGGGPTQGPPVGPGYYDYRSVGGKGVYDQAFDTSGLVSDINAAHQAHEGQARELEDHYRNEAQRATNAAAARKVAAEQDAAGIAQRQQELDRATRQYSAELQDTGKFWHNPGNILAAISYSLMPIFSNDPTVGVKLINDAINQDLAARRAAADGTLGALRSNLDGYRRLAGDRQAGDQLAEAEARRVAADDVQRIAAKFASPIAKAQASSLQHQLLVETARLQMTTNSQGRLWQPDARVDPLLYTTRATGAMADRSGARGSAGIPGAPAANSTVAGSPSVALDPKVQAALAKLGVQPRGPSPDELKRRHADMEQQLEKQVPGGANLLRDAQASLAKEAFNMTGQTSGHAFTAAYQKAKNRQMEGIPKITELMVKNGAETAKVKNLQQKVDIIDASERQVGNDPNRWFGPAKTLWGEQIYNRYDQLKATFESGDSSTPAEAAQKAKDKAVREFRQDLQSEINKYRNQVSGAAVTSGEKPGLNAVISSEDSYGPATNWLKIRSRELEGERGRALDSLEPWALLQYLANNPVGGVSRGLDRRGTPGPVPPEEKQSARSYNPGVKK